MGESNFKMIDSEVKDLQYSTNFYYQKNVKTDHGMDVSSFINMWTSGKTAEVALTVTLFNYNKDARFLCTVSYHGLFEWDEGMSNEDLKTNLNYVAPGVLYSYVRPILIQVLELFKMPVVHIPLMILNIEEKDN